MKQAASYVISVLMAILFWLLFSQYINTTDCINGQVVETIRRGDMAGGNYIIETGVECSNERIH